ncbi:hypothetical protein H310_07307 [Aphanomyces invadans]|uniref:Myosin-binding domain-containing protein n=1 Tax=Aphanomyces invadans TaxID=157072 RepID=A0A024U2V9_9STRA|nr:hypothetical protein H310_07307 [Aphanomyces invadans]ETW00766.1 hypothetical protein H310_07307 [Aphanomyces invadans]|eukprot:XP_008870901.1 hypothetical protein H310_07307 [Aphanomyces invadans]
MYETHRRGTALDEYLASVSDEPLFHTNTKHTGSPTGLRDLKTKVLQRVLPLIVSCIHRAAPSHIKTDVLKTLAFAHSVQSTHADEMKRHQSKFPRTVGKPSTQHPASLSFEQSFPDVVQARILHLLYSAVAFAAITTTFLTHDATITWPSWQQSTSFAVAGLALLHVLFPLIDLVVIFFYVVWYRRQRQYVASQLALFHDRKQTLELRCNNVLRQIKAAAAAQRGYLLDDAWMPPIGRLEANESKPSLSCVAVRQMLYNVYTLIAAASAGGLPHENPIVRTTSTSSPSLLLMALSNQHTATMEFLEQSLVNWRAKVESPLELEQVLCEVQQWLVSLHQALLLVDDTTCVDVPVVTTSINKADAQPLQLTTNGAVHHARVLQSTMKTALAVLFATESDTGFDTSAGRERTMQSLARVGDLLDAAQVAWAKWQAAVLEENRLTKSPVEETTDAPEVQENPRATAPIDDDDAAAPNYTEVFTAVSTGLVDRDVRPDQVRVGSASLLQSFDRVVHELHDVLVRRPLPEERVQGADTHVPLLSKPTEEHTVVTKSPAFVLPATVSSELQAALFQLHRRPAADEEFLICDESD